ncbi:hypothetical protein HAZT_HAZT002401 [Hyalella azteca]|uniref:Sulfatase N-terminal domain-containing protein n=1 Tax=Hyalella azteca TaxID=294128 RepID=A0A6A0H4I4_HYAAZ|nr:hypothetical protein HAZT_HAZT002401 [Hyalella azteca]
MAAAALHALVALAMHWVAFVAGDVSSRPHVVFILVDDLGYNDVSWHNPAVKMPNIASLAAEGVTLEQSYVLPVCTPTRSAILTGRYPYTIGRQASGYCVHGSAGLVYTLGRQASGCCVYSSAALVYTLGRQASGYCVYSSAGLVYTLGRQASGYCVYGSAGLVYTLGRQASGYCVYGSAGLVYTLGRQASGYCVYGSAGLVYSSALKPLRPTGLTLNATLLPEALKTVGYHTHAVGKWHLGFCKWQYTPTYRGFDSFFGFYTGGQKYYTKIKKADLKLDGGRKLVVAGYDFRSDKKVFFPPEEEYSSVSICDVENKS